MGSLRMTVSVGVGDNGRLTDVTTNKGYERGPVEQQAGEGVKCGPKDW